MVNCTYGKECCEKEKWFKNNNKLVIVRYNDEYHGNVIGAFSDDNSALEYIEEVMERDGKFMTMVAMPWMNFNGYLNANNNTYKHKVIQNATFRDTSGSVDSEVNFWFQVVEDNCLLK